MFVKREVTEGVYVTVPQRLSDMAKAKLLKFQCPVVVRTSNGHAHLYTDAVGNYKFDFHS